MAQTAGPDCHVAEAAEGLLSGARGDVHCMASKKRSKAGWHRCRSPRQDTGVGGAKLPSHIVVPDSLAFKAQNN